MRIRPLMLLCVACLLSLTFCNRQSAAAKAKAEYQAQEKALDQQLQQNSKNYDQRLKQLEANCGPLAPGFAAPKNAADCAKLKAQWQHDQSLDFDALHNTPVPGKQSPVKPKG